MSDSSIILGVLHSRTLTFLGAPCKKKKKKETNKIGEDY
jgi:hypothetical protein